MPEVYTDEIWDAVRALVLAGMVAFAFKTAKEATLEHGRWWTAWRGIAWCLGIALLAAAGMGEPSCESDDPLRGTCTEYADDGYEVSTDQRVASMLFWLILLSGGVLAGVFAVPERKLTRPDV